MGLLDNQTQQDYYSGNDFGGYQFISLNDIINNFIVAYVGDGKIIPKAKRTDIAFHAQRAIQELSFDTFKSIKSQEITLPPSNTMVLPQDYVNYTRVLWTDSSGIKRPIYPTKHTQNPFKILQEDDGGYDFTLDASGVFDNGDFSKSISSSNWTASPAAGSSQGTNLGVPENDTFQGIQNGQYEWKHIARILSGGYTTRHFALWQTINVTEVDLLTISAKGLSSAAQTGKTAGIVRIGLSTQVDTTVVANGPGYNPNWTNPNSLTGTASLSMDPTIYDVSSLASAVNYIEFNAGDDTISAATLLEDIDVSNLTTVDLLIVSSGGTIDSSATLHSSSVAVPNTTTGTNAIDDIILSFEANTNNLQSGGESTTWGNFQSSTSNDASAYNYDTDIYDLNLGQRYGLEPSIAQSNGTYFIDTIRGLIHFSSNLTGRTIVLDYISDGLGTDEEMIVHKFAEEAMYKSIAYAIFSTTIAGQQLVPRFKKEKFAAIRQAKLRLSNLKIEELAQMMRGKSKFIKH